MPDPSVTSIIPSSRPTIQTRAIAEGGAWLFSLAIIAFSATVVFSGGLFLYRRALETSRADWDEQIATLESELQSRQVDELIATANALSAAGELIANHVFSTNTFKFLEETTHSGVRFNSFVFDSTSRRIELSGVARSYRAVADQTRILEAHPRIESVEFGGLSRTSDSGNVSFKLTIIYTPGLVSQRVQEADG